MSDELPKPNQAESEGETPTIRDLFTAFNEPIELSFLSQSAKKQPEETLKELEQLGIPPLSYDQQIQMVENMRQAEIQRAQKKGVTPATYNFDSALHRIKRRQEQKDETPYYGIVRTAEEILAGYEDPNTQKAEDYIIDQALSKIKW